MEINSEKARDLDIYIKDHADCEHPKKEKEVELEGQRKSLSVYVLPIEKLRYNIRNGRFKAELLQKESELKRKLDPDNKDDSEIIKQLLLDEDSNATKSLMVDLKRVGQLDPGIITNDGAVIDANRRMAIFEKLYELERVPKYQYLLVARLPPNVSEKDLWRLEAGIQLSRPYKKEYGPINELLKLREGKAVGLNATEIASSLYGNFTQSEITEKLDRLELIENYLEYINKPKRYDEARRYHEHFIDLQKILASFASKGVSAIERQKATILGFELIKSGKVPHLEVRKLREIVFEDTGHARNKFFSSTEELVKQSQSTNNPKRKTELSKLIVEEYRSTLDYVKAKKEADKPRTLLTRALQNLENINPRHRELRTTDSKYLLNQILKIIKKLVKK